MSGTSTPNPRFTASVSTAEDVLRTQTEGLVALSDFRKRRAEAIELKAQEAHSDGASTPKDTNGGSSSTAAAKKKKKRKVMAGTPKLSFGGGDDDDENNEEDGADSTSDVTPSSTRAGTPNLKSKAKLVNASVGVVPKALTKSALLREAQTRETLRKEFLAIQETVKAQEIAIPFVFYDGTDIPGGVVRVKKGDFIWVFLDKSRKVGAEMGVGRGNTNREWARVGVDDLMVVRGGLIIPHHYDFYYFIINHTLGPNNRVLFDYSSSAPSTPMTNLESTSTPNTETYNPLSRPSDKAKTAAAVREEEQKNLEGAKDDPSFTKVVDRRWYERNKHIFPASVWQEFDPEKDYQREVKRDAGGNAFFFS